MSAAARPRLHGGRLLAAALGGVFFAVLGSAGCASVDAPSMRPPPAPFRHTHPPAPLRPTTKNTSPRVETLPPIERTVRLGESVRGAPIEMIVFGRGEPCIFVIGGIHGSEPGGAALAHELIDHIRANPKLAKDHTIAVLAEANPDGLARKQRTNANRVDVNRNFPAKNWKRSRGGGTGYGSAALSEPETRAIVRAVKMLTPACIVSIHSISTGRHCNNYDGPARELAELMGRFNAYPVKASMGYPTPGSLGSWAGVDLQIPTLTLELPHGRDRERVWRENREAFVALLGSPIVAVGK